MKFRFNVINLRQGTVLNNFKAKFYNNNGKIVGESGNHVPMAGGIQLKTSEKGLQT